MLTPDIKTLKNETAFQQHIEEALQQIKNVMPSVIPRLKVSVPEGRRGTLPTNPHWDKDKTAALQEAGPGTVAFLDPRHSQGDDRAAEPKSNSPEIPVLPGCFALLSGSAAASPSKNADEIPQTGAVHRPPYKTDLAISRFGKKYKPYEALNKLLSKLPGKDRKKVQHLLEPLREAARRATRNSLDGTDRKTHLIF